MNSRNLPLKVLVAFIWSCGATSALLWAVTDVWPCAPGIGVGLGEEEVSPEVIRKSERSGLILVMLLGAVGGFLRWIHLLSKVSSSPNVFWQWVLDSALTPLLGSGLALISTLTFRAALTQGGTTEGVNWIGIYALAGLAGLFSPEVIGKLRSVMNTALGNIASEEAHPDQSTGEEKPRRPSKKAARAKNSSD